MHAHLWELGCVVDGDGVGANVSDGAGVIVRLPVKLVPPGSAPPPESAQELKDASLLDRLSSTRVTTLFSDGAPAWPNAARGLEGKVKCVAVSHKRWLRDNRDASGHRAAPAGGAAGRVALL